MTQEGGLKSPHPAVTRGCGRIQPLLEIQQPGSKRTKEIERRKSPVQPQRQLQEQSYKPSIARREAPSVDVMSLYDIRWRAWRCSHVSQGDTEPTLKGQWMYSRTNLLSLTELSLGIEVVVLWQGRASPRCGMQSKRWCKEAVNSEALNAGDATRYARAVQRRELTDCT